MNGTGLHACITQIYVVCTCLQPQWQSLTKSREHSLNLLNVLWTKLCYWRENVPGEYKGLKLDDQYWVLRRGGDDTCCMILKQMFNWKIYTETSWIHWLLFYSFCNGHCINRLYTIMFKYPIDTHFCLKHKLILHIMFNMVASWYLCSYRCSCQNITTPILHTCTSTQYNMKPRQINY